MPEPGTVAKTVVEVGSLAWENRSKIGKALAALRKWLWGSPKILVIGPGGTGKTTLSRILSGEFDWLTDSPWKYDESYAVDRIRIKGRSTEAFVAPGQKLRRGTTWAKLRTDLAAGKFRGVILVSSFGYHSITGGATLAAVKPGRKKDAAIAQLLAENRAEEVDVLRELSEALKLVPDAIWLLSLVTKEDLWTGDEATVRAHYASGEYAEAIRRLEEVRGVSRFRHELAFASLVIGNRVAGRDERLAKNTEGYDHQAQVTSVRRVFDLLDGLRKWEK